MKRKLFIIICLISGVIAVFVTVGLNKPINKKNKISVIATLFPLYDFAKNIGRDKLEVSLLLPPGVEAHAFEPKPSDIAKINGANIFIFTGRFMEPWAGEIIAGIESRKIIIVDASYGVKTSAISDSHVWLNFDYAKIMVDNVARAFIEADPVNLEFYEQNAKTYKENLTQLDNRYTKTLLSCKNRKIIYGGHYAFGYMAARYNLTYMAAQGVSPDSEPTAYDLAKLVDQIKKDNIKYIFYEELTSPKIAETIAKETNAKMLLLNGAHNLVKDDFKNGLSFFNILESNLNNLKIGLECQ